MKKSKVKVKEDIIQLLFDLHVEISDYFASKPDFLKEIKKPHKNLKVKKEVMRLIEVIVDEIFLLLEHSGCMEKTKK